MPKRELILASMLGAIGALALALSLLGFFTDASDFHPLLENQTVQYGLLATGVILILIELKIILPILIERSKTNM